MVDTEQAGTARARLPDADLSHWHVGAAVHTCIETTLHMSLWQALVPTVARIADNMRKQLVALRCASGFQLRAALLTAQRACRSGFSLLFYGYGSKRALLDNLAAVALTDGGLVIVNGWQAGLTAKQIVLAAASALTGKPTTSFKCVPAPYMESFVTRPAGGGCRALLHIIAPCIGTGHGCASWRAGWAGPVLEQDC